LSFFRADGDGKRVKYYWRLGLVYEQGCVMRAALLAISAALALPVVAQPADLIPWMTGARLVELLGDVDQAKVHWGPDSPFRSRAIAAEYFGMANREFVHGYIQAVHDATEGKAWCWSEKYKPKPDELEADARLALLRMPDTQLKRNAADLIVEVWRKTWPCTGDYGRKQ